MSQFPRAVLRALLLGALLLSPVAARAATIYYVSPSGLDTNSGSQAAPFRQIRRALQSMVAGDTALVADGSYLGFNVANKNGTAAAPITVKAVGTGALVTPTTDRADNRDTIFITFSSYVVIDGLRAFNANRSSVRIDESPHTTVRNGVFGNNAVWGIFTDFSDDLLLEYNECYGSVDQHGIYVSNSGDRPVVRGNICHDNHDCGIQWNADVSMGDDGIISGGLLENNVCYNNGAGGGAALNLDGVQDTIVRNNLLFNNRASGLVCYVADGAAGPHGMVIVHNTIDMPAASRWCVNMGMTTGPNLIRNNILINRDSYRGSIDYYTPDDLANTDSDYNVLAKITTDEGDTITTLAQLKALGKELHSIAAAPTTLWANPAPDYHLKTGAPAVDIGDNANSAPKDLDGQTRPQGTKVDLGCYEQAGVAPPDVTPPAASTGLVLTPGNTQIGAAWNANTESDLAGYFVYRATAAAGPFSKQNANPLAVRTLTQTSLTNGQTYWYRITAVDTSGNESSPSETKSATPVAPPDVTPPAAPTGLTLTPGNAQIGAAWNANGEPDLAGYNVYRATSAAGPFTKQNGGLLGSPALTQTGLTNGQTYWYRVTAVDASGNESSPSETKNATPVAPPDVTSPAAPTGLTLTPGGGQIGLVWNANGEPDLAGYNVYRATAAAGPFSKQNGGLLSSPTFSQTGLTNGQTYWYRVTAVDTSGNESSPSETKSTAPVAPPDVTPPAAPTGLTLTPGGGQIGLVWNANGEPDLAGYNVYRATAAAGPFTKQNGALLGTPNFTQTGLANGQTYWYYVTAVDGSGNESAPSETKSATPVVPPDSTAPAPPTGLTATPGDRRVVLTWNTNTESDLAGYYVYRATSENGTYTRQNANPLAVTTLTQTGLTNGQTYWYHVTAVDTTGNESGPSAKRSAKPAAPAALLSLTFNPASVLGGQSSQGTVTLNAPAPAGGAVVALKSGNSKVTLPGSVTVPAGAVSATFTAKTDKVATRREVTVTATYKGVSKSATLTLRR